MHFCFYMTFRSVSHTTPLLLSAEYGHGYATELLLTFNADVYAVYPPPP